MAWLHGRMALGRGMVYIEGKDQLVYMVYIVMGKDDHGNGYRLEAGSEMLIHKMV